MLRLNKIAILILFISSVVLSVIGIKLIENGINFTNLIIILFSFLLIYYRESFKSYKKKSTKIILSILLYLSILMIIIGVQGLVTEKEPANLIIFFVVGLIIIVYREFLKNKICYESKSSNSY